MSDEFNRGMDAPDGNASFTPHSILRTLLSTGFNSLVTTQSPLLQQTPSSSEYGTLPSAPPAPINFIDPATTQTSYFDMIETSLTRDHNLTLHNIPYQNTRSGTSGTIESLPIQCIRMGGGKESNNKKTTSSSLTTTAPQHNHSFIKSFLNYNDDTPVASSPTVTNNSDPTEWHTGAYCHVYIAACENADHYKTKVRPGLSAFVSQIESAASSGGGGTSHQYLIVYVPCGKTEERRGGGLRDAASRFVSRRDGGNKGDDVSVMSSGASVMSGGTDMVGAKEKELFRKMSSDFPNGRLCVLSTLAENGGQSGNMALQSAEWNNFLRNLGLCVVSGFRQRCKKYDEMLRSLDKQRMTKQEKFDMAHYFMVKESLIFCYEQMQLPGEALLLYQELNAFIGSGTWVKKKPSQENVGDIALSGDCTIFRECLRNSTVDEMELQQYLFSREVYLLFLLKKPVEVIERVHHFIVMSYKIKVSDKSLSRMTTESWGLKNAWDVKCACDLYFNQGDNNTGSGVAVGSPEEERDVARVLSELLEFARLRLLRLGDENFIDNPIRRASLARPEDTLAEWGDWEAVAQKQNEPPKKEDIVKGEKAVPDEKDDVLLPLKRPDTKVMKRPSVTANSLRAKTSFGRLSEALHKSSSNMRRNDSFPHMSIATSQSERKRSLTSAAWLQSAFQSEQSYESKYLELLSAIITLYNHSGRQRFAARLQGEQAEIYMLRKDYNKAENTLLNIADICARDQWDKLHFWRLFRLACCQRKTNNYEAYLKTLVMCFSPRLAKTAPVKTYNLFQTDLEALVSSPLSQRTLSSSPFLETELSISDPPMGKSYHPLPYLRKKLVKYNYLVGDKITVTVQITSHLPRAIDINQIRLFLLTFDDYERIYRRQGATLDESDAYRILSLSEPGFAIEPGKNECTFDWIPMTVGQFVLASVQIEWKNTVFLYDSAVVRRAIQGVEVLPSEPTQTVELNPLFLIPGDEQEIRLVFNSGKDIITNGTVELSCSEGLEIIKPDMDDDDDIDSEPTWVKHCTLDLKPCQPDQKVLIKTKIKSEEVEKSNAYGKVVKFVGKVQTLHARVTTSYHHALYTQLTQPKGLEPESPPMTSEFEAMVTTLDRPALTVNDTIAFEIDNDSKVLVSVSLRCNTPLPFFLKEWNVTFPHPLSLAPEGDKNDALFTHPVTEGEILYFSFVCHRELKASSTRALDSNSPPSRPVLNVVLTDEFGKMFHQVLTLDLDNFYDKMTKQDEYPSNIAKTTLTLSSTEGSVGSPVHFAFDVNLSASPEASSASVIYNISCMDTDWILGGRVRGVLPSTQKEFRLEFVGIPTQSGIIKTFPFLELKYEPMNNVAPSKGLLGGGLPPIMVHCRFPEQYRSLTYMNHMALACPSALEIGAGN